MQEVSAPHGNPVAKIGRIDYLKEQFITDYKKAIKKNKLLHITSQDFKIFASKLDQPFNIQTSAPRTEDGTHDFFAPGMYIDPAFFSFKMMLGLSDEEKQMKSYDLMFNFFLQNDPTPHKEYLSWYLNLYRDLLKQRKPFAQVSSKVLDQTMIQDGSFADMIFGGVESRFFEDLFKVSEALEKFDFIKKTKTIHENQKDINKYQTYEQFLKLVKPFMGAEEGSVDVDTLDHKELKAIENQVEFERGVRMSDDEPRAKLMFQNDRWIIVYTVNKSANSIFGKYTTWCTAGTRYNSMFEHYDKDGKLFVLIKKGYGSKTSIDRDPSVRLQFHFYSNQYMDALDKSIKIAAFLDENEDIKEYFKHHIVKEVLPRKKGTIKDQITFLMNLGYGDQLIKIYKDVQPKAIDLSGFKMKAEFLDELGEIDSIERLTLNKCEIKALPKSLMKLKKLESLSCSSNTNLVEIPEWFNSLTTLREIAFTNCDIRGKVDFSGMTNLETIRMDYNGNLKEMPVGVSELKKLSMFTISNCNLSAVSSDIVACKKIYLFDVHHNVNLKQFPTALAKNPETTVICIDDTRIPRADIQEMRTNNNGFVSINGEVISS